LCVFQQIFERFLELLEGSAKKEKNASIEIY